MTIHMSNDFQRDIDAVQRIDAVPRILEVICRTTGMGFSAVARVTEDRWICCAVRDEIKFGLAPGGELKVETTICDEIRDSGEAVVIDQVSQDAAYCQHPTPAMYGFQSYISMPIVLADGTFFGTLCAIDPRPAKLKTPETVGMFKLFAELIAAHLNAVERLDRTETSLAGERRDAELREQFIAVLGHDLRNPLASIQAGLRLLPKARPPEKAAEIVGMMQNSITRMSKLVDNVHGFRAGPAGRRSDARRGAGGSRAGARAGDRRGADELSRLHDRKPCRPARADPVRPLAHRTTVRQPACQCGDAWRERQADSSQRRDIGQPV